jgi:hypothetical protein
METHVWRYPEWWSLALSMIAWTLLAGRAAGALQLSPALDQALPPGLALWLDATLNWLLMAVAMMVPLTIFSIRLTAARSLWRRRDRAVAGFLIGYLGLWFLVGSPLAVLEVAVRFDRWIHVLPWLGATGFAVAAVWQLAPTKSRALRSCHRTMPLAPRGWRADWDCVRFGWLIAGQCLTNCWPLMLAGLVAGHSLTAMMCASAIGFTERYLVRPRRAAMFSQLVGVTMVYALLAASSVHLV